jgi:type VI secretion system protein VasI
VDYVLLAYWEDNEMSSDLQQAIAAIKAGDKSTGKRLLAQVLRADPRNESAWLWLAYAVDDTGQKRECLERVLAISPSNEWAREQLESIQRSPRPSMNPAHVSKSRRLPSQQRRKKQGNKRRRWPIVVLSVSVVVVLCISLTGVWWLAQRRFLSSGSTSEAAGTPTPSTGKWRTHYGRSSFDDSKTVVVSLEAEKRVTGWLTTYTPELILRCQEHETDAYIVLGMQPDVEYGKMDSATVRIRFDKGNAQELVMYESTDGEALFFRGSVSMIKDMMRHDEMVFGFTPFNASPTETTFDLQGLSEAIKPLRETCDW